MPYKAFLSYSHAADVARAPAIRSALHRFAKPWYRLRAIHVFRDQLCAIAEDPLSRCQQVAYDNDPDEQIENIAGRIAPQGKNPMKCRSLTPSEEAL